MMRRMQGRAARGVRRVRAIAAVWMVTVVVVAPGAVSAAERRIFHLPAEPVNRAVVRFAIQGDVSVGGLPSAGCDGVSRATYGLMTPARALAKLLPPGCDFQAVDAGSFRVFGAPPQTRNAPPPQASPAPGAVNPLDELVVTAERRAEPLVGRAYAITALSGDELRRLGGKSFSEAALQMVGVTVTNLGSGRNKIFVRGLSDGSFTGHTQSTVGLYLDDVPITYSAPDPDLRLVDIERVEVLRGPQGTLYGSGSIGGIVRLVTAKPDPQAFAGEVSVEALATQNGAQGTGLDGVVNVPLLAGRAAVRLVAYRDERPGYIDNVRLGLKDVNYGQRSGVRVTGLLDLSQSWRIQAGYAHQSINTRDSQYAQGGGVLTRDAGVREPHDNDFSQVSASITHAGEVADLKVSLAFIDHSPATRYDATGAFGLPGPLAFDEERQVDLYVADAVLTSAREGRLQWLGGVFASQTNETDHALLSDPGSRAPGRMVYRRRDRLTETAVYGEAAYDVTPRLRVTAGGRLFVSLPSFDARSFSFAPSLGPIHRRLHDSGVAPKLRVSYAWSPNIVLYGQIQEGYRAGGFNLPAAADGVSRGVTASKFQPDRLRSYEIGGTVPLLDQTLTLRAAVFHADWSRLQTDQYLASGLPMTVNIGDGANTGVEVEAVWRPNDHWQIRGNLLVEDPTITRASNAFPASVDIGLPGVSSVLASADVRYRWTPSAGWRAEASGQVAFVGHSFLTFDGAKASRMGDYGVGRLTFALESEHLRLQAYLDNVTDERANTFAFGNPFSRTRALQSTPLRPRTIGVSLSRNF